MASLSSSILNALKRGPTSTVDLAEAIGQPTATILEECKRLKEQGRIKTVGDPKSRRLLFCIDHRAVVTGEIYPECDAEDHELRYFYHRRLWALA